MADGNTAPQMTESQRLALEIVDELLADPVRGREVRAKAKEKNPNLIFAEDRVEAVMAPLKAENDALKARLDALDAQRAADTEAAAQRKADLDFEERVTKARSSFNLNAEGYNKMLDRMKETANYTDADAAAAWVAAQNPAPAPAAKGPSWAPEATDFYGTSTPLEEFKLLHKDPQRYQDEQLRKMVADPDGYVAETERMGFLF